ncbi:hypothetical protein G5V58_12475 [Nocardioides anomalus]|uniref:Uncharacterized protein n=1 Tax=Nocardioides anomalus TaxID=2712223 RepID=A0A6G6WDP6_9ACTN|nr:hypothetical protein [Nocardioides anomalus]QIG43471.1 hypothetical protein G5V58_12475 [Nocardioides anomalus]
MRILLLAGLCGLLTVLTGCQRADVDHPGGDAVVLQIVRTAGMGPGTNGDDPPPLLEVLGDGTVSGYRDDGTTYSFRATEADVQRLLHRGDDAGLLDDPPDYEPPTAIWDAGNTEVLVVADGHTREHVANGLGAVDESGARARLEVFVDDTVAWARSHAA